MYSVKKGNLIVLFFIIHFIAGSFLVLYITENFSAFGGDLQAIALSQIMLVLIPVIYSFFLFRTPIFETLKMNRTRFVNLLLSGLLAIFILPIVMLINVISQFFVKQALGDTLANIGNENYFYALIAIAVFPALFEEMIARGILLSHYRNKSYLKTSLMSGFFFGMMHLNINQFLYAFFLGFLFSLVVHLTGSIFCSMLMHFLVNGINLSIAYFASSDAFKALSDIQDTSSMLAEGNQSQLLFQALPVIFFLVILSLPFVFILLFALSSVNEKSHLLFKMAPSYMFFAPSKNYNELIQQEGETKELNAAIIEELSTSAFVQKNSSEKIFTLPLFFTIIIFLVMSVLSEFL